MQINYQNLREYFSVIRQTQQSAADIAGISRSTLSRYIATGKPLPGEVLIAWQKAFGWSADYLAFLCLGGPAPRAD